MDDSRPARAGSLGVAGWRASWLGPGGLSLLLALLTANVLARGPLVGVDQRVRDNVHALAISADWRWLAAGRLAPAQLVTDLGSVRIAGLVLAVSALAMAIRRRSLRPLLIAAAGGALLAATVIPAKILIGRPGPGFATLPPGSWGDFPSGHSCTAGVCFGLAALLLTAGPRASKLRRAALAVTAVGCFLVGAALVWCDYHWLTDVIAGWALAVLIVWAVWQAQQRVATRHSTVHTGTQLRSTPDGRARA
jgi:membrane-associated phospholipid phosphatase